MLKHGDLFTISGSSLKDMWFLVHVGPERVLLLSTRGKLWWIPVLTGEWAFFSSLADVHAIVVDPIVSKNL